jgi:hypothetical protein
MPGTLATNQLGFIPRWLESSASERANYALFLSELSDFLHLPRPEPSRADEDANTYVIDKAVFYKELDGSMTTNFIDLYKRNCFVLEAKQGSDPVREGLVALASPLIRTRMFSASSPTNSCLASSIPRPQGPPSHRCGAL